MRKMATVGMRAGRVLLERAEPLATLETALDHTRKGRGRLLLVGGEAGVGKTALVRRFCDELSGAASVLWGGCDPLHTPRPLGPFLDIAEAPLPPVSAAIGAATETPRGRRGGDGGR